MGHWEWSFLCLPALDDGFSTIGEGGGEQVNVSSVFQFQPFAEFADGCRKVPYGKVGLL